MRLKEGLNRIWVAHPDDPESSIPATLDFRACARSEIIIDVLPDTLPPWLGETRVERLFMIAPERATLIGLLRRIAQDFGGLAFKFEYQTELIAVGAHVDSPDFDLCELTATINGCNSWFGRSGFKPISSSYNPRVIETRYEQPKDLIWQLPNGTKITYGLDLESNQLSLHKRSFTLTESSRLTFETDIPRPMDTLLNDLMKVIGFIELLTSEPVAITSAYGKHHLESGECLSFYAPWKQGEGKESAGYHWMTFFEPMSANFGDHLARWFELYDKMPLALALYRSTKNLPGLQVEFLFFSIVSAIEALHRSFFDQGKPRKCGSCKRPYGLSLEQRLKDVVASNRSWFEKLLPDAQCERVAATRNFLAHHTPELEKRSFPSDQWFFWYRRLALVFEFSILAQLPFEHPEALTNIIEQRLNAIRNGSLGEWNF